MFDGQWLVYPITLTVIVGLYTALGFPFAVLIARRSSVSIALAPVFGLAILAIAGCWYSLLERPMQQWPIFAVAAVCALVGLLMLAGPFTSEEAQGNRVERIVWALRWPQLRPLVFAALPWVCGIAGFLMFVLPVISDPRMPPGFLTSFTSSNNDLGSYIQQSANIQLAGFGDSGLVPFSIPYKGFPDGLTLGGLSLIDHPGAMTLMAGTSTALGISTWQAATSSVLAAGVALTAAVYALAIMALGITRVQALVVSMLASMTGLVFYVTGQAFYAQLLAMALVVAQVAMTWWAVNRREWLRMFVCLPVLAAATFFISPEVQVIAWATIGVVALIAACLRDSDRDGSPRLIPVLKQAAIAVGALAVALAATLLLFSPFVASAARLLLVLNSDGVAGWPMRLAGSLSVLVGIDSTNVYETPMSSITRVGAPDLVGLLLLMGAVLVAGVLAIRDRDKLVLQGFLLATWLSLLIGIAARHWGPEAYQTWKLALSYSPILVAILVAALFRGLRNRVAARHALIAFSLVVLGANIAGNQEFWRPFVMPETRFQDRVITLEYAELLEGGFMQSQPGANFRVESLFLTMASPSIYGKPSAIAEVTYFTQGASGHGFPFPCTVARAKWDYKALLPDAHVVLRTPNYMVVGSAACGKPLVSR